MPHTLLLSHFSSYEYPPYFRLAFGQPLVVFSISLWNIISIAGSTSRIESMEITAPREISVHRLLIKSILEIKDTPIHAAKKDSPDVIILGADFAAASFAASITVLPLLSSYL